MTTLARKTVRRLEELGLNSRKNVEQQKTAPDQLVGKVH